MEAAFLTHRGLFEPLVMFFGLTNSPATFQTMMNELLRDLINTGKVLIYIDDILIFTNNLDEHRKLVRQVLSILSTNKLYLKPEKCEFEKLQIEFLGLIVSEGKVEMDPAAYKLKLLQTPTWHCKHDVFNDKLLKLFIKPSFDIQPNDPPAPPNTQRSDNLLLSWRAGTTNQNKNRMDGHYYNKTK